MKPALSGRRTKVLMKLPAIMSFGVGMQMLRTNPLRTVLSTLGIIIGVAALVAILALGDGLERFSRQQIEETTDLQIIQIQSRTSDVIEGVLINRDSVTILGAADARDLNGELGARAVATLTMAASLVVQRADDSVRHAAVVTGLGDAAAVASMLPLHAGRWLQDGDTVVNSPVIVLGRKLADDLGNESGALVGSELMVGRQRRTVVGIVDGTADAQLARAYVQLDTAGRNLLAGSGRIPSIVVRVTAVEDVPAVESAIRQWLTARFKDADRAFNVVNNRGRVEQVRQAFLVFKLALGAIAGISVLVGGIGIMNILLASVQERTREIGVRRSAGARRSDIFLQFLAESVTISMVGSLIGVLVGLAGVYTITAVIRRMTEAQVYAAFTWTTLAAAASAAILVGIAFGSYPARYAAGLSPIDAIRHE
jgi:putative ABC transport system permease protein